VDEPMASEELGTIVLWAVSNRPSTDVVTAVLTDHPAGARLRRTCNDYLLYDKVFPALGGALSEANEAKVLLRSFGWAEVFPGGR
jgi:hypothetical protein